MIRSTRSTILLKFGCKAHLKKTWNPSLTLSLRRGPCQFHIWLRGLDWFRLASRFLSTLTGKSSQQQQPDRELWDGYLLWGDSEGDEVFVPPDFSAWFLQVIFSDSCIVTCTARHWRWWSRWPTYRAEGNCSLFNSHWGVTSYIL